MDTFTKQDLARKLVNREIYYCASQLITHLSCLECGEDFSHLMWRDPDTNEYFGSFNYQKNDFKDEIKDFYDGDLPDFNDLDIDDWRNLFEYVGMNEPDPVEVYEHWIVSDYLARKLEEYGEVVDFDVHGLTIWGRCTTGQSIMLDDVIEKIAIDVYS